jgi:uncharacterized protein (UPF0332 family)
VTKQNIRKNIKAELERALNVLSASVLLFDNGFFNDAVSRLYYFVLHNIRALLLTKGLEPKSHEGALRLFGLNFVKEGIFGTGESHIFSKMMKFREEADYNPAYFFTREDFILFKKEAEELADKVKVYLGEKGYL